MPCHKVQLFYARKKEIYKQLVKLFQAENGRGLNELQLPEKYNKNLKVSSEGPAREVSSKGGEEHANGEHGLCHLLTFSSLFTFYVFVGYFST